MGRYYIEYPNGEDLIYLLAISISKMNTKRFTINITAGFAVVLLLIGGTGTITILFNTGYAQSATLGEPNFVEK